MLWPSPTAGCGWWRRCGPTSTTGRSGVQPFGALVQDATVTIPAMLPAEVEAAIVEPARRAGRTVERALAAELVGSMASTSRQRCRRCSCMLYELADRSPDGTLSLAAYRALGGLEGAIAARAEGLYQSLDDPDRDAGALDSSSAWSWSAARASRPAGEPPRRS